MMRAGALILSGFALAWAQFTSGAIASSVESFYKGQTLAINVGSNAGGGFDLVARLVARHLRPRRRR